MAAKRPISAPGVGAVGCYSRTSAKRGLARGFPAAKYLGVDGSLSWSCQPRA